MSELSIFEALLSDDVSDICDPIRRLVCASPDLLENPNRMIQEFLNIKRIDLEDILVVVMKLTIPKEECKQRAIKWLAFGLGTYFREYVYINENSFQAAFDRHIISKEFLAVLGELSQYMLHCDNETIQALQDDRYLSFHEYVIGSMIIVYCWSRREGRMQSAVKMIRSLGIRLNGYVSTAIEKIES